MLINMLICSDSDEPLLNETVNNIEEAKILLDEFEHEYNARLDHITGGDHE